MIVLNEVDSLSRGAQHALRRTMEKYGATCRLILCSQSTGRVLEPVRSRCLCLRVGAPSVEEVAGMLQKVGKAEGIGVGKALAERIAEESGRNARRALLVLEAMRVRGGLEGGEGAAAAAAASVPRADWEEAVGGIARDLQEEQSPGRLLVVRGKLYELLGHCIPGDVILQRLVSELLRRLDASLQHELVSWAAYFDHRMRMGSKPIFHLEAFCARFMAIYKAFLASMSFE